MAAIDYEPRTSAIDEEHVAFKSSKLNTLYKATLMRKVNDIKRLTNCHQIHASLIPKFASQLTPVSQLLKGHHPPGFAAESQAVEQCHGPRTAETNDLSPDSPRSSDHDDDSSSEELDKSDVNIPDCDNDRPETSCTVSRLFYNSTLTDYGSEESDISLVLVPRPPTPKIKYFFEQDNDTDDTAPSRCSTLLFLVFVAVLILKFDHINPM